MTLRDRADSRNTLSHRDVRTPVGRTVMLHVSFEVRDSIFASCGATLLQAWTWWHTAMTVR